MVFLNILGEQHAGNILGMSLSLVAGVLHKVMRVAMALYLSWIGPVKTVTGRGNGRQSSQNQDPGPPAPCPFVLKQVGGDNPLTSGSPFFLSQETIETARRQTPTWPGAT